MRSAGLLFFFLADLDSPWAGGFCTAEAAIFLLGFLGKTGLGGWKLGGARREVEVDVKVVV